mmetsp:Transcript_39448/g.99411  ORF Transcript_39448/g.99411 Transcript_39448/m.99411 type:complete len:401 (-) Transcript_39448:747-1949(-)
MAGCRGHSSRRSKTTWLLAPDKPYEFTHATKRRRSVRPLVRLTSPSHPIRAGTSLNAKRAFSGAVRGLGGTRARCRHITILTSDSAPDAASMCPNTGACVPSRRAAGRGGSSSYSRYTSFTALSSAVSPMESPLACISTTSTSDGCRPACSRAEYIASCCCCALGSERCMRAPDELTDTPLMATCGRPAGTASNVECVAVGRTSTVNTPSLRTVPLQSAAKGSHTPCDDSTFSSRASALSPCARMLAPDTRACVHSPAAIAIRAAQSACEKDAHDASTAMHGPVSCRMWPTCAARLLAAGFSGGPSVKGDPHVDMPTNTPTRAPHTALALCTPASRSAHQLLAMRVCWMGDRAAHTLGGTCSCAAVSSVQGGRRSMRHAAGSKAAQVRLGGGAVNSGPSL